MGCSELTKGVNKETFASLGGSATGAWLGSKIGKGSDIAMLLGSVIGGYVGNQVGKSLDQKDKQMLGESTLNALEKGISGKEISWLNPDSGNSGKIIPEEAFYNQEQEEYCRKYKASIVIDGKIEEALGVACRNKKGKWILQD